YRLLRDAEFEKASRGGLRGTKYPWGDQDPLSRCDFNNPDGAPKPVGSYPPMATDFMTWLDPCGPGVRSASMKWRLLTRPRCVTTRPSSKTHGSMQSAVEDPIRLVILLFFFVRAVTRTQW